MATFSRLVKVMAFMYPLMAPSAMAGSLKDLDHVVLFMQENRAFNHYFGTMAGVRGFSDPNVAISNGKPVWYQDVNSALTNSSSYLLPWYLNYLGGTWLNATQCMEAGDNGYQDNHAALNNDLNNHWATNNTPWSWGYFERSDIPVQFAIADAFAVGDMYQESVIASTNPNRVTWASGSINSPGGPQSPGEGGNPYIDNNETPGCDDLGINCYPLKWKTFAEYWQDAGVDWQLYQDVDNFDDNPLAWFAQYQTALPTSPLYERGMAIFGLDAFYKAAADGTLPAISYIIGPTELSEHPPYSPRDGAWLTKQIVDAVTHSPLWHKTALIISFDETGGFGDSVVPYHSPPGTAGEWISDPYGEFGNVYTGPGFRLPFTIVSPFTRGGSVFTEHSDHNSQILFVEQWLEAKGYKNVQTKEMAAWRRAHMSDLTNAFDFDHPDFSIPDLPYAIPPHQTNGVYDGSSHCESLYPVQRPPVPYGKQNTDVASLSEQGFKSLRGKLTEGRYLVFEMNGYALANSNNPHAWGGISATRASNTHNDIAQRWVAHVKELGGSDFTFSSAKDGQWVSTTSGLTRNQNQAATVTVGFKAGSGYNLQLNVPGQGNRYVSIDWWGNVQLQKNVAYFAGFSVTYHS